MANTKSAAKRARQTAQRTLRNKGVLTGLKRQQKKVQIAVASGDMAKARVELTLLSARLDKAAKRGIVHKNLANRRKSRAAKAVARTVLRTAETPGKATRAE
jgi:small subunit ribosomal protein S20